MSYLIVYMSRHGTTAKVVEMLVEKLGQENTTLVNLEDEKAPALTNFHTVIIGGSVHAGRIQKDLREFCSRNFSALLKKRLGLFMCFMNYDLQDEEFEESFPRELRLHAVAKGYVGGEFLLEKMNMLERLAVKKVKGIEESVSRLDYNAIDKFINDIIEKD
jgi:menaquinone-dependent protoporphyrinogen oxidase